MLRAYCSKWLLLILIVLFSLTACSSDYEVPLPGGYVLVSVYAGAVIIGRPSEHEVVVDANVESYKVLGELVVGHVNTPEKLSSEEKETSKPGYFILNTKTHEIKVGLDKQTWLDSLQTQGVSSEPRLRKPSSWDRILNKIY
jgi:hypothetical protein